MRCECDAQPQPQLRTRICHDGWAVRPPAGVTAKGRANFDGIQVTTTAARRGRKTHSVRLGDSNGHRGHDTLRIALTLLEHFSLKLQLELISNVRSLPLLLE